MLPGSDTNITANALQLCIGKKVKFKKIYMFRKSTLQFFSQLKTSDQT